MSCRAFIGGLAVLTILGCEPGDHFGESESGDPDAGEPVVISSPDEWVEEWLEHVLSGSGTETACEVEDDGGDWMDTE